MESPIPWKSLAIIFYRLGFRVSHYFSLKNHHPKGSPHHPWQILVVLDAGGAFLSGKIPRLPGEPRFPSGRLDGHSREGRIL